MFFKKTFDFLIYIHKVTKWHIDNSLWNYRWYSIFIYSCLISLYRYFSCVRKTCKEFLTLRKYLSYFFFIGNHYNLCLSWRWYVHVGTDCSYALYSLFNESHFRLFLCKIPLCLKFRPGRNHYALFHCRLNRFVRLIFTECLIYFFRNKRHKWVQEFKHIN